MPKIGRVVAAALAGAIVSAAAAQDAVQWRVEDGGNGHWYMLRTSTDAAGWESMLQIAQDLGGYLASVTSEGESVFLSSTVVQSRDSRRGALIGAFSRDPGANLWTWVSGERWDYTNWYNSEPKGTENLAYILNQDENWPVGAWDDTLWGLQTDSAVIEWSADCNGDGIVDYGQILDGNYADTNGNGVPDCCEGLAPCPGDLNLDGRVDSADLGLLIAAWNTDGSVVEGSDINGDGIVNAADLGLQIGNWGECSGCN